MSTTLAVVLAIVFAATVIPLTEGLTDCELAAADRSDPGSPLRLLG